MASQEPAVDHRKLPTKFFHSYVQHTIVRSDSSLDRRRVQNWHRRQELGRGSFGTVFLEESREGEFRAVKEVAKSKSRTIDRTRELTAMAILAKVRDMNGP